MNIASSLVGVHGLEIDEMAHDMEFSRDPVRSVHVARHPRDLECLGAVVAFDEGDGLGHWTALLEEAADA